MTSAHDHERNHRNGWHLQEHPDGCPLCPPTPPIVFSARRGAEELHVQVVGGVNHPSGNAQLVNIVLEVRLGPDLTQHGT